jgi:V/A-type H+-transporting ATPase subunit F
MHKIAVIGGKDSILGFGALGLETYFVDDASEAAQTLARLAKENYGVIYLTEEYAKGTEDVIARYKDEMTPAIILIPGAKGSLGIGMRAVSESVERAVGADILFKEK